MYVHGSYDYLYASIDDVVVFIIVLLGYDATWWRVACTTWYMFVHMWWMRVTSPQYDVYMYQMCIILWVLTIHYEGSSNYYYYWHDVKGV
jgi:hypothetical protein